MNQEKFEVATEACKDLATARKFVSDVQKLSKKYKANFFLVTDGASGCNNGTYDNGVGNEAVRHARDAHKEWERLHGFDPEEDWSKPGIEGRTNGMDDLMMYYMAEQSVYEYNQALEAKFDIDDTAVGNARGLGANNKAFNLWHGQFKPRWKQLQKQYYSSTSIKDKQATLWLEKELLLNTREAILDIDESLGLNVAVMMGMLAVTFGLSAYIYQYMSENEYSEWTNKTRIFVDGKYVDSVTSSGYFHNDFTGLNMVAQVTKIMGVIYTVIKLFNFSKGRSDTDLAATQKFTGVISKQILIDKVNGYIRNVDQKLQAINAGRDLPINKKALDASKKYSDKYSDQLVREYNKASMR